ncbi:hypothetical protein [Okeania sp. SIO2B3]|uniref:hypothetical protein n=1 Tax=Okeania sp. SIO2B3 TaxID=2607784 RepID=UPI0013BF7253|nr:hypothetical protein [Okeania sp. SIO2B3]NET41715.1 hypothetical protein [Okeania sp. SIO2B3]
MKKALKIVACLLIALTVALATNVSNASAQPAACDKSSAPTCYTTVYPGDCQEVPLPGYDLAEIKIALPPGTPVPQIYPPPKIFYNMDIPDTEVSAQLNLAATATYTFNPLYKSQGQVCNDLYPIAPGYPMPFTLSWKNIPPQ